MSVLVLDSEAVSLLAHRPNQKTAEIRAALTAAFRLKRRVIVPAVVLAELYRGPKHSTLIDACLSRETGIEILDTDKSFARLVGGILVGGDADSRHIVDAHVVAAAVQAGRGVIVTGDPKDLISLAAPYSNVTVVTV